MVVAAGIRAARVWHGRDTACAETGSMGRESSRQSVAFRLFSRRVDAAARQIQNSAERDGGIAAATVAHAESRGWRNRRRENESQQRSRAAHRRFHRHRPRFQQHEFFVSLENRGARQNMGAEVRFEPERRRNASVDYCAARRLLPAIDREPHRRRARRDRRQPHRPRIQDRRRGHHDFQRRKLRFASVKRRRAPVTGRNHRSSDCRRGRHARRSSVAARGAGRTSERRDSGGRRGRGCPETPCRRAARRR